MPAKTHATWSTTNLYYIFSEQLYVNGHVDLSGGGTVRVGKVRGG